MLTYILVSLYWSQKANHLGTKDLYLAILIAAAPLVLQGLFMINHEHLTVGLVAIFTERSLLVIAILAWGAVTLLCAFMYFYFRNRYGYKKKTIQLKATNRGTERKSSLGRDIYLRLIRNLMNNMVISSGLISSVITFFATAKGVIILSRMG
ncbi:hypothetical protein QX249_11775 [Vibrio parahaemolyticus]|uniref:Uncharacterized protein n=1 Tax=Vibrio parahaemolyticus TaxID=670 RepID=A0AAW8PZV6_VIBPH|nr:hypothetical protein [Vibrio parahaemolyticus]EGR2227296.1 hypothetical protein [Vibrio parahaemolyticus]MDS1821345.1 hypothetical protein [Vibrio parahaemolyticus]